MASKNRARRAAIITIIAACLATACDRPRTSPSPSLIDAGSDAGAGATATPVTTLVPGGSASGRFTGRQHHDYRVSLRVGQLLSWTVQQHDRNVSVQALAPDGTVLLDEDYDRELSGREAQAIFAEKDGVYTIRIKNASSGPPGTYDLVLAPAKTPTADERALAEAMALQYRSGQLVDSTKREDIETGVKMAQDLVARFSALGERRRVGFVLLDLGIHYSYLGDTTKAREAYLRAQREFGDYRPGVATAQADLANLAGIEGDALAAIHLNEQALAIEREIRELLPQASTLANLGTMHLLLDEPEQALDLHKQSLAIYASFDDRFNQTWELINIGDIYRTLGDAQSALESLERAVTVAGDGINDHQRGYIEQNEGLVYLQLLQREDVALEHFRKALALREHMGDEPAIVRTLDAMAAGHEALGQHAEAIETGRQALARARKMHFLESEADLLSRLGGSELAVGHVDAARAALDEAITIAQKNHSVSQEARARGGLARLWGERGDLPRARHELERALALAESARARVESADLRTGYFSRYCDYYDLYVDLLLRDHPRPDAVAKAFAMHERSRARTLLELLEATRTRLDRHAPPELVTARDEARRVVKDRELEYRRLIDGAAPAKKLRAAEQALAEAISVHHAAEAKVRAHSPPNVALDDGAGTLAQIQARLPADTVLLEYALGDKRSHLWWLTAHSLDVTPLAPRAELEAAARRYYELVTARSHRTSDATPAAAQARIADADGAAAAAAQALSQLLLGPVANRLAGQRLVIVADGALEYVPFAALPVSGGRTLLEDHELSSLPSASVLPALARRAPSRPSPTPRVAVFADPVFDAGDPRVLRRAAAAPPLTVALRSASDVGLTAFHRLHFSRAEAEAIAALTAPGHGRIALDFAASRAGLADLRDFDIIHFATHGILNSRHSELSGLVLSLVDQRGDAVDGFLRLHDIYELDLNARLVVLSACETALGKEIRGEGLVGLTHGFLYAGAEQVLATLWPIQDKSTAELFATFYAQLLREGARPGAALRAAQLALAHSPSRSAPFYWAPFVLQGELD